MVRRENDPDFINRIANSASVRPFIDHLNVAGPLDLSSAVGRVTQTGILWLSNGDDALAAFEQADARAWSGHLMFGETCRGRKALAVAREMLDHMRPWSDEVWGLVPIANRAARWFARQLGFSVEIELDDPKMGRCEALVWRPV